MPLPYSDIQYAHYLFFVPAQSAILPLFESVRVVWPVNSLTTTLSFRLLCLKLLFVFLPDRGSLIRVLDGDNLYMNASWSEVSVLNDS